jgi:transcriptional regulator with XRE-family HTH domain
MQFFKKILYHLDMSCDSLSQPFFDRIFIIGGDVMDYIKLGERIREERLKLGLTQSKLAEDIDISDAYMGHIERGERSLTLGTLMRLVNRLHVSVDYLLQDYTEETDENIVSQFKQIIDGQNAEDKNMAIDVLKTIFSHINRKSK